MAGIRVVLDTNVLVSGLAYPLSIPGNIVSVWRQGGLDVVLSHFILDELRRVLPRLKRITLTPEEIRDLLDSLMFMADIVEPIEAIDENLRDNNDQPVLQTFVAAQAEYLITGDKDLLILAQDYPIITPGDFWRRHG